MKYLKQFSYVIKYKKGKTNIVVDGLSKRYTLFAKLGAQRFDNIVELYSQDAEFSTIYQDCLKKSQGGFYVNEGYLFKEGKVCILQSSYRKLLIKEMYEGELIGHFGVDRTLSMLKEKFFWPYMRRDVQKHCYKCIIFLRAKSKAIPHGLHTPLPIDSTPWKDISM